MRTPDFWSRDGLLPTLLGPAASLYGLCAQIRAAKAAPQRVPVPVICAGNLVAGGAGKTPLVLALLDALAARGLEAQVLSRGYGGLERGPLRVDPARHSATEVGDEPLLLARKAVTWVARDRLAGAKAAVEGGAKMLVLDDGFQNRSLAKDLSLLAVDGAYGFGNGRLHPAGPLREPVAEGIARAQAIVLIGEDHHGLAEDLAATLPVLRARLTPGPEAAGLRGRRVLAFAGIGRPQKFFDSLSAIGAKIAGRRAFPDHHPYRPDEIAALKAEAARLKAALVTTEKDRVRLDNDLAAGIEVLSISLTWQEPEALDALLRNLTGHGQA